MPEEIHKGENYVPGIAGILNYEQLDWAEREIQKMMDLLSPNSDTRHLLYYDQNIILGLPFIISHVDVTTPCSPKKRRIGTNICVLYSGDILVGSPERGTGEQYGHNEQKASSFVEKAYQDRGLDGLADLNGSWSVAIWEPEEEKLVLATNNVGMSTMYYGLLNSKIYFSSDLRSLISVLPKKLDFDALCEYLHFLYIPTPKTIYAGISAIPRGTALIFEKGTRIEHRFGSSRFIYNKEDGSRLYEEKTSKEFEHLLLQSVADQKCRSGVTGILLSGGKDSSAITVAASIIDPKDFHAFTVGFEDTKVDETKDAEKVSKYLKIPHRAYTFSNKEYFQVIDDIARCFGQPFGDSAAFPVFLLTLKQKNGPQVLLDGTGADWYFGIPASNKEKLSVDIFRYVPLVQKLSRSVFKTFPDLSRKWKHKFRTAEERFVSWNGFDSEDISWLIGRPCDFSGTAWYSLCHSLWNEKIISYKTSLLAEIWEPHAAYRKIDVIARYFSKVARFPLADKRLSDFVNTLPNKYKFRGYTNKILLRKFLEHYLPKKLLEKPKGSFVFDPSIILDYNNYEALRKYLNNSRIEKERIFSSDFIRNMTVSYMNGDKALSDKLFALVLFQSWLDQNQEVLDEIR